MKNIKLIEDKKNDLFSRREIIFEVEADVTPSKADALKMVAEQIKVNEEQVALKNVLGKFGVKNFKIVTFVYDTKEAKELNEPKLKEAKK